MLLLLVAVCSHIISRRAHLKAPLIISNLKMSWRLCVLHPVTSRRPCFLRLTQKLFSKKKKKMLQGMVEILIVIGRKQAIISLQAMADKGLPIN